MVVSAFIFFVTTAKDGKHIFWSFSLMFSCLDSDFSISQVASEYCPDLLICFMIRKTDHVNFPVLLFDPSISSLQKLMFCLQVIVILYSKSLRLVILKNHLRCYAYKVVCHLSILDANFDTAVEILNQEFQDKKYIVGEIFKSIIDDSKPNRYCLGSFKMFLTNLKAQIYELKNSFVLDFLE